MALLDLRCRTQSRYSASGDGSTMNTVTVMRDGKPCARRLPRIPLSPCIGRVKRWFDDVLVPLASGLVCRRYTEGLEPWDLSQAAPYPPRISGRLFAPRGLIPSIWKTGFGPRPRKEWTRGIERRIVRVFKHWRRPARNRQYAITRAQRCDLQSNPAASGWPRINYLGGPQNLRFAWSMARQAVQGERPWSVLEEIAFAVILWRTGRGGRRYGIAANEGMTVMT